MSAKDLLRGGPEHTRFKPGNKAAITPSVNAGRMITNELSRAALAKDGQRVKDMCEWIISSAAYAKDIELRKWAATFVCDRIVGRPAAVQINQQGGAMVVQLTQQDMDL